MTSIISHFADVTLPAVQDRQEYPLVHQYLARPCIGSLEVEYYVLLDPLHESIEFRFVHYRDWKLEHDSLLSAIFEHFERVLESNSYDPIFLQGCMELVESKIMVEFEDYLRSISPSN
jgi:hypothetical protein